MDELSFWDQEGHAYVPPPCGDCIEETLQPADVAPVGRRGYCDREVVDLRNHEPFRDRHVKGRNIYEKTQRGDWGPLWGAYRDRGGGVRGSLEQQGASPFRQEGGDPVNHVRGYVGGQEPSSEGGGVDIVEAGFDVEQEGGDLQPGSLKSSYLLCEGEAGVGGAESW